MTSQRPRCAAEALTRDEPLFATASLVRAWLLIEQRGAWGPDALTESSLPESIGRELKRRAGSVRVLLIRRRSAFDGPPRYFKAHSGGDGVAPSMVAAPMPHPAALLEADMEALAAGEMGPGTAVDQPLYLVCTHGRHDICCADRGRPLYRTLSAVRPEHTWEVSHLGGDRFAGNILVLPRGDYFGRVEPAEVDALISNYESGRLSLRHHRGRSIQPRLVQAAEHLLREAGGIVGHDDLVVIDYQRPEHDHAQVVFESPEGVVEVQVVARQSSEASFLTCRADQPGFPVSYELVSMTPR